MTEREYVEHILRRAKAYIGEIGKHPGGEMDRPTIEEWSDAKRMMSPHTLVRLCETWLEAERSSE